MSAKIGRNEPCPCGSGKKYKKCCGSSNVLAENLFGFSEELTGGESLDDAFKRYDEYVKSGQADKDGGKSFMEFMGKPNSASKLTSELHKQIENMNFSSIEDANKFLQQQTQQLNGSPKDDFLGLSSDSMHTLLYAQSLSDIDSVVRLKNGSFKAEVEQLRLYRMLRYILQAYEDSSGSLQITARGGYKTDLVKKMSTQFFSEKEVGYTSKKESENNLITFIHYFLACFEYTEENATKSYLTPKGRSLARNTDIVSVWAKLLEFCLYYYEWMNQIREEFQAPVFRYIQDAAVFSLFILKKKASSWISQDELYTFFRTAFPNFDPDFENSKYQLAQTMYEDFTFSFFALEFGLIEFDSNDDNYPSFISKVRISPFFKKIFEWQV